MLKMIFYFAMDDRNVKMLSTSTSAMCSSKISANTLWHSVEDFLCSTSKRTPPVGTLLPHSPSGPPLQGWPNLASVFPNHPKIRWNCNIFNCFDKDVRTSTTSDCTFVNKLLMLWRRWWLCLWVINTIIIFFNAFLTVVALTTNFQLAHKYFHLSLLHAPCLLEPQTSLKNHAHLFLLQEVQLHHVLP